MSRAKKSFRLELTKEQQAIILQNTETEAGELELTEDALRTQKEPKPMGKQPQPPHAQVRASREVHLLIHGAPGVKALPVGRRDPASAAPPLRLNERGAAALI
jgi:hypothetical protein